jgi:hypothetical protein
LNVHHRPDECAVDLGECAVVNVGQRFVGAEIGD